MHLSNETQKLSGAEARKRDLKFTDIYNDYFSYAYSIVYSKVSDVNSANDITQEVFTRLYEKFDTVLDYRKWICGAIRFVVIEHIRKKSDTIDPEILFNDISLSFVNGFRDTRLMLEEAFESPDIFIDEKDRLIFDLIANFNFTYEQTGEQLGLAKRQVRYRYGLIAERFVSYFRKSGIDSLEDLL